MTYMDWVSASSRIRSYYEEAASFFHISSGNAILHLSIPKRWKSGITMSKPIAIEQGMNLPLKLRGAAAEFGTGIFPGADLFWKLRRGLYLLGGPSSYFHTICTINVHRFHKIWWKIYIFPKIPLFFFCDLFYVIVQKY